MSRLSIIVPLYNVENWVLRCLESLYNQNLPENEFEVIIINDGSKDNSLNIVNQFAKKHNNIIIISQENRGLSAARNIGIKKAKNKYIWFIDSDDFIEANSINEILELAEKNNLDALCFNYQLIFENGKIIKNKYNYFNNNFIFSGDQFVSKIKVACSPCFFIFKKDFLIKNSLFFIEGILHEDEEFTPRAQYLCKRIAYTDKIVYNYFQREGSIMKSSQNELRVRSFIRICDSLYEFLQNKVPENSIARDFFLNKILFCFSQAFSHSIQNQSINNLLYKDKPYYPLPLPTSLESSLKIKGWLINNLPYLYVRILYLIKIFKYHK